MRKSDLGYDSRSALCRTGVTRRWSRQILPIAGQGADRWQHDTQAGRAITDASNTGRVPARSEVHHARARRVAMGRMARSMPGRFRAMRAGSHRSSGRAGPWASPSRPWPAGVCCLCGCPVRLAGRQDMSRTASALPIIAPIASIDETAEATCRKFSGTRLKAVPATKIRRVAQFP